MRWRFWLPLLGLTAVGCLAQPVETPAADNAQPLSGIAKVVAIGTEEYSLPHTYCEILEIETLEGSDCSFAMRVFKVGDELRGFYVAPGTYDEAFPIVLSRSVEDRLYLYRTNGGGLLRTAVRAVETAEPRIVAFEDAVKPFADELQFWHSKEKEIEAVPAARK